MKPGDVLMDQTIKDLLRRYPDLRDEILRSIVDDSHDYVADLIATKQAEEAIDYEDM